MHRSEKPASTQISVNEIERYIYTIREQQVMLDSDIANIYKVETKMLKRAVRRNIKCFPPDFMFELTKEEQENLRCQNGTLQTRSDLNRTAGANLRCQNGTLQTRSDFNLAARPNLRCQNGTLPNDAVSDQNAGKRFGTGMRAPRSFFIKGHDHFRFAPFAFTEEGVAMLSGVLHTDAAVEIKVSIMRAFVQLKNRQKNDSCTHEIQMSDFEGRLRRLEQDRVEAKSVTRLLSELDTVAMIKESVAYHCGVMVEDLESSHRSKAVSRARHVAIYIMRKYLRLFFPEIALHFFKDHTSIMYAYERIEKELEIDETLRKAIVLIGGAIGFC